MLENKLLQIIYHNVAYYLQISFEIDFKKDLKLKLQESKMVNIVTKDVQTYVKELISKEFNPATKTGYKIETNGKLEGRYYQKPQKRDNKDEEMKGCES